MKRTTLLLIFLIGVSINVHAQDDTRAAATWRVQKYDITASLPQSMTDRSLVSKASLNLKNVSGAPASTLTLRISPAADVSAVSVNGSVADFSKREEKISATGTLQRIVIRTPSVPPDGSVNVSVDYKLAVKENSGVGAISPAGSQILPLSFWYPTPNSWYFARGADFAPFHLKASANPGQTVLSSGVESAGGFDERFGGQPFFVTGSWDPVNTNGVTVYMPKGSAAEDQKRAAEMAALANDVRAFAAGYLGPAPDAPVRIVAARRGAGFTEGGTIFISDSAFRRSRIDAQTALIIAEGVVRSWLGSSVAINGDGQAVLREGLVRYIATEALENKFGKDVADVERLRQRTAYAVVSKRDAPLSAVSPLDDFYFSAVANKGAMLWRLLEKRLGRDEFRSTLKANLKDNETSLAELRAAFSSQKEMLDYMLDNVTDMNLLAGLPQVIGDTTRVALRNTGGVDATVDVTAGAADGQVLSAPVTIRAQSFGEVNFKSKAKIVRAEVDPEKLYPQSDYSDDVAPRESTDSDLLLNVKRSFDKQDFATSENVARKTLASFPRFDEVRILLARSLAASGRAAEAEKEFRAVLDEKLPTARSLAWASVGLAEIAVKSGQSQQASRFAEDAIRIDGDYGASLAARTLLSRLGPASPVDADVKAYFAQFDKAAASNRKADIDAMVMPGDAVKFANGISGQTEQWQTDVTRADKLDADTVLVEARLNIKLLNKDAESGTAVFRLARAGSVWKLSGVEMFEVR